MAIAEGVSPGLPGYHRFSPYMTLSPSGGTTLAKGVLIPIGLLSMPTFPAAAVTLESILNAPPEAGKSLAYFLTHGFLEGEPGSLERLWAEYQESIQIRPSAVRIEHIRAEIDGFDAAVIEHFRKHSDEVYQLTSRQFEALIAAILKDQGCDVHLTPQTRDGGHDIIAVFKTPHVGEVVTLVECKRYSPERKVGVDILRKFLYVLRDEKRAPAGMIATSSSFSQDATALAAEHELQLRLKDFEGIKEWLGQYGKWTHKQDSGIWVPNHPVVAG